MRWHRKDYIEQMTFGSDRPMLVELFGPLIGLEDEWRAQGATPEELDLTAFGFDHVERIDCGANTGLLGGVTPRVLEETASDIISIDEYGRRSRLCKGRATIPLPLDYPVTDMASWQQVKTWFSFSDTRIDRAQLALAKERQKAGAVVLANIPGGFDLPRQLMGEEQVCYCYYDQPELMDDILQTAADTSFRVFEQVTRELVIDVLCVHEDLAGKSGPLIGPDLVRTWINPYFRRVWDLLQERGTRIFSLDSDGNVTAVIDAYMEGGVNRMYPMEPAAGMDIVRLRAQYGSRLAMQGGIDKHVLRQGIAAIDRELEYKLRPELFRGCAFGLDHRIPNGTPLASYRHYVRRARELLGMPELPEPGWARMAF